MNKNALNTYTEELNKQLWVPNDPVRKVNHRGSPRVTGCHPSLKMRRNIAWESLLERDFVFLAEFDRTVAVYYAQPLVIRYMMDGKLHAYYPDFKIVRTSGTVEIAEVKTDEDAESDENDKRFKIIEKILNGHGADFHVYKESEIRAGVRPANIEELFRYLNDRVSISSVRNN